jgi:uncharacterized membrane protein YbhN (UPF0104 family)
MKIKKNKKLILNNEKKVKNIPLWQALIATLFFSLGSLLIIYDSIINYYQNNILDWLINFICFYISIFFSSIGISTILEKIKNRE